MGPDSDRERTSSPRGRCARWLLSAWEDAQAKGLGAVQLDGRMVDRPIAERARHVIEMAEAIAGRGA